MGWGKREIIYLSPHCHHQNDSCIKMGSNESHFNVSEGSDGQSHKTVSTNYNLFEEKGEPKRYRTEVLPLTSLKPTARPNRFMRSQLQTVPFIQTLVEYRLKQHLLTLIMKQTAIRPRLHSVPIPCANSSMENESAFCFLNGSQPLLLCKTQEIFHTTDKHMQMY